MNKYFYLLTAGLLLFSTGRAQVKKGQSLLGGSLWFEKLENNPVAPSYGNATMTYVMPSFGKAIKDNLVAGVTLNYGYSKLVQSDGVNPLSTSQQWSYGLGFFIRRYKELGHNFSFFVEGDLNGGYTRQKTRYQGADGDLVNSKWYNVGVDLGGGIAYRLTRRWMLETGFADLAYANYAHSREEGSIVQSPENSGSFRLGTNLYKPFDNFVIGCRYILN